LIEYPIALEVYLYFLHPRTIKSRLFDISKVFISGLEINTLGLPPNFVNLASIFPNALETYSVNNDLLIVCPGILCKVLTKLDLDFGCSNKHQNFSQVFVS